jgi:hypothetical protein
MQPVVVVDKIHRYKENAIVRYMLDEGTRAGLFSLNTFPRGHQVDGKVVYFKREDHEQLAQLIGYSVSGACDLSYMSDAVCEAALKESQRIARAKKRTPNPKAGR